MNKNDSQKVTQYLYQYDTINENDFKKVLSEVIVNYNDINYRFYVSDLNKKNIIYKYNSNKMKPSFKRTKFNINLNIDEQIRQTLEGISPSITISIWNASIINKYESLQFMKDITIIETYDYATEEVIQKLLSIGKSVCYYKDYFAINKYLLNAELYIVKNLCVDSPIIKKLPVTKTGSTNKSLITTPKVEKLLVDLFADSFYQKLFGGNLDSFYREVLSRYQVNFITLQRYAKKRHCNEKLLNYLTTLNFDIESGEFK